ncbi:MAG: DUF167 domain-containing protein [Chloroflexi bacterium]|nr:MAG: DUF167 domain-containing protein [Chloroflexota bacterium]
MTERKFEITDAKGGVAFTVRCVTRSARTEAAGIQEDGTIKVRLQASPAGSPEANQELIRFLASVLGVEESHIEIVAGADGRDKLVSVEGITTDDVNDKISQFQEE